MKRLLIMLILTVIVIPMSAQNDDAPTLTIVTYDSFALSEDVLAQFVEDANVKVEILRFPDAGDVVNQSILSKNNPLGDVLYGVDNTFLGRALDAELFTPYESTGIDSIDQQSYFEDTDGAVTPVTYGDVCLNYDVAYFAENDLPLPESLADLTDPAYEGMLVVEDPASSSPGLAFLLTTIAEFGEEGDYTYLDFWDDLVANDALVVDDWTQAYYGEFSAGSEEGTRPLVVSYASSPPVEVLFAETELDEAPTGAIVADNMCFRQIEYVGILDGTDNLEAAQAFVDFTLSVAFQEDLPLQMFVFPVNEDAELPELFQEYAAIPENPVAMSPRQIDENRDRWLQEWTETVLR
jgi:thiamine transport system substrate-binding protein